MQVSNEVLQMVKTKIDILYEAFQKDDQPEAQIAFRTRVANYNADGISFQVVVEICTNKDFYIADGDIDIITDPRYGGEPYKTIPAESKQQ